MTGQVTFDRAVVYHAPGCTPECRCNIHFTQTKRGPEGRIVFTHATGCLFHINKLRDGHDFYLRIKLPPEKQS